MKEQFVKVKAKASNYLADFEDFIYRGNIVDFTIGMVLGTSSTTIVNGLVTDMFTPIIALAGVGGNLEHLFTILRYGNKTHKQNNIKYATVAEAAAAGAVTLNWGRILCMLINFAIIGVILFLVIQFTSVYNKLRKRPELVPHIDGCSCPECDNNAAVQKSYFKMMFPGRRPRGPGRRKPAGRPTGRSTFSRTLGLLRHRHSARAVRPMAWSQPKVGMNQNRSVVNKSEGQPKSHQCNENVNTG